MVHFGNIVGTSMAESTASVDVDAQVKYALPDPPDVWAQNTTQQVEIFNGQVNGLSLSNPVSQASEMAIEVGEQMAILTSMKDDLNPERVAALLRVPAPED